MRRWTLLLIAPLAFSQPRLQNSKLETRAAGGSLEAAFRGIVGAQAAPAWIGYAAPQIPGDRTMCCFNTNNGVSYQGCSLEPQQTTPVFAPPDTVRLEGAAEFFVFFRVENKQVEKIRTFSIDCNVDGGGLPFFWLTGVNPSQSVALLESLIPNAERKVMNGALGAIGMTRDAAADAALDRLSSPSQTEETRRQAAFWLGNARGPHGFDSLVRILRDDPSDRVRENAIFGMTQSKEPGAIPAIVRVAREDKIARVRGQALFWLAQKAERQISEDAIRIAIEQDPESQVKRRAVSALMQIKNGEGVPMLIEIARTNKNAAIRKEAMQELGRSKDPRAVKFFEDVLAAK
jgi:hypothetical protein